MPRKQRDDIDAERPEIDGVPAGDRPDEIALGGEDPETVDIMGDDDSGAGDADSTNEDELPSREQRTRDEYEDAPPRERRASRNDDDSEYSKKVQRRINREYALRQRAEKRAEEERIARQDLEQRLQKIEREQAERQSEMSIKDIEAQMRETMNLLTLAKDNGDTAKEVELQAKLGELQGQKVIMQAKAESQREARSHQTTESPDATRNVDPAKKRGIDWVGQQPWWNLSRFKDARNDAVEHDKAILNDIERGDLEFEKYSDEHLEELARRLKTDHPDLDVRAIDGSRFEFDFDDDDQQPDRRQQSMRSNDRHGADRGSSNRQQQRAPVGGMGGRDGRRERSEAELARQGKVRLNEDDFRVMRQFKLDPNDPVAKKYFAKERARTILSANGGRR